MTDPPRVGQNSLALVFAAPEFRERPDEIDALTGDLAGAVVVGCSAAGVIHDRSICDEGAVVAVADFERTALRSVAVPVGSGDSHAVGRRVAEGLTLAGDAPTAILVFSDGLSVNGSELVRGIRAGAGDGVLITGGLAADDDRFEHTWVLVDGRPQERQVTAVGLHGDSVRVGWGSRGGWDLFGPERVVTRSDGNVLYELGGEPALDVYVRYLGRRAAELPASAMLFPLAVRASTDGDDTSVVRTVLAVDEADRSMTFAGDVPTGHRAQLMRAHFDHLVDGAAEAAAHACPDPGEAGSLCIAISCVGRRLALGERVEEELDVVSAEVGGAAVVGFYSYGELAPSRAPDGTVGPCELHNQTMTVTSITEAPA